MAVREPIEQQALPGVDDQPSLPFPTMDWGTVKYKVTGIVTNRMVPADEVIWWYRKRCGKSEEAHSIVKEDLAGGKFPSGLFGANAAWRQIVIPAFNLNASMNLLVLGGEWVQRRLKSIRFWLINVPGRVMERARRLVMKMFPRLRERKNQLSGTLSGGEQQMLAIGRALMSRPKVLLLDEPSLGLAPIAVQFIFETIKALREESRISVLMVEQNARAALRIAERGYILETGRIIMEDVSAALMNNPDVQKAFLGGGMS